MASRGRRTSHPNSTTPLASSATFWPETASRWYRPEARNASRSPSLSPSSSPSTTPASTARRSTVSPSRPRTSVRRSRSAKPPTPPRRRRSASRWHAGGRGRRVGAGTCARRNPRRARARRPGRRAPARALRRCAAGGSSSCTVSETSRSRKRSTRAGTRISYCPPRRGRDDRESVAVGADLRRKHAAVERVEPCASPPPARRAPRRGAPAAPGHGASAATPARRLRRGSRASRTARLRSERPADERSREQVRAAARGRANHGATSSVSCSSRAGPIPGIASSSRTELNAPCFSR